MIGNLISLVRLLYVKWNSVAGKKLNYVREDPIFYPDRQKTSFSQVVAMARKGRRERDREKHRSDTCIVIGAYRGDQPDSWVSLEPEHNSSSRNTMSYAAAAALVNSRGTARGARVYALSWTTNSPRNFNEFTKARLTRRSQLWSTCGFPETLRYFCSGFRSSHNYICIYV